MATLRDGIEVEYCDRLYNITMLENVPDRVGFRAILVPINNEQYANVWLPPDDEPPIFTREGLIAYLDNHGVTPKE
ncbi:MAG: hypothetical protein E6R05_07100 [Candidatus Moraniibacteriota bacterium]|nr:MAG: hypothetical protein E6R05_07100 [Candidatus Moranbacteria bacterium]